MNNAIIFPGQGSQQLQMLSDFHLEPIIQNTFSAASEYLGYDLWQLAQHGPQEQLNNTAHTQPILLTAGIALYYLWQHRGGVIPTVMAGHSLGEYTALVAAQSLDFKDACMLTALRGSLMQKAVPIGEGLMAAIIGLDDKIVEEVCAEVQGNEVVAAANYNAPGQIVISGNATAVHRACELAEQRGASLTVPLAVSVPSHSRLMQGIAEEFADHIQQIQFAKPAIPVIHNVDLSFATSAEEIRKKLIAQLYSPVRWVDTILKIKTENVTSLIECGPGRVLTGLNKRIDRSLDSLNLQDETSFANALQRSSQ